MAAVGLEASLITSGLGADFFLEERRGHGPGLALLRLATRSSEIDCVFVPVGSILQEDPAKSGGRQVLRQTRCFLITIVL